MTGYVDNANSPGFDMTTLFLLSGIGKNRGYYDGVAWDTRRKEFFPTPTSFFFLPGSGEITDREKTD